MQPFLRYLFILAGPFLASACTTSSPPIASVTTIAELKEAYGKPALKFSQTRVLCTLVNEGKTEVLPALVLVPGKTARCRKMETERFPADYKFPEPMPGSPTVESGRGAFPVTPAVPKKFAETNVGWTLELVAEPRQSFVMLTGTLFHRSTGAMIRSGGTPFKQIEAPYHDLLGRPTRVILTENRAARPVLVTREIPILIAATPGEVVRVYLDEDSQSFAEFRCEVKPASSGKPIASWKISPQPGTSWELVAAR